MKKRIVTATVICILLLAAALASFVFFVKKQPPLTFSKKVVTVQTDTLKVPANCFGSEKLSGLIKDLEAAAPLSTFEASQNKRTKDQTYYALSFIYEDDTRDVFSFYQKDNDWYLETADGRVYSKADFITEYTLAGEKVAEDANPWDIYLAAAPPDIRLVQYGMETGFDLRFRIAAQAEYYIGRGSSLEDALKQTYNDMKMKQVLYECAKEEGYEISAEEYAEYRKEKQAYLKTLENYDALEAPYKEAGTTLEAADEAGAESSRISYSIECLRQAKREAFRTGEDTIDGEVYDTANAYWNGYAWNALLKAEAELDFTDFDRDFAQAAQACEEEYLKKHF